MPRKILGAGQPDASSASTACFDIAQAARRRWQVVNHEIDAIDRVVDRLRQRLSHVQRHRHFSTTSVQHSGRTLDQTVVLFVVRVRPKILAVPVHALR